MSVGEESGLLSVDRALQILQLLGRQRAVRVMDVADHLGVARSTAHRLLTALLRRGFVIQDATKQYHRGPAFAAAGFGLDSTPAIRMAVRPHLEELAGLVEETCHVVVLEGNGARFIDSVERAQVLRVGSRTGMLLPAHTTAAGKVLLAELSAADFFALYPRGLPGMRTEMSKRITLQHELASVRKQGYATNFDESEPGVTALAVAVKDAAGRAVAALAVACPSARCPRTRVELIVQALRETAAAASAAVSTADYADDSALWNSEIVG